MPKISFAQLTSSWETLSQAVAAQASEPLIEARRRELEAALAEVQERLSRQVRLRGQAADNTQLLHEAIARGKDAEARLRAFLKGTYGRDSVKLFRFGLRPQRQRRRAGKGEADTAEPIEAEAVEAPAAAPVAEHPLETPAPSPEEAPAAARRKPTANARRRRQGSPTKRPPAKRRRGEKKVP